MIFSRDVLFIHVPKTGGTSLTHHLLDVLPRPVYYVHPGPPEPIEDSNIAQLTGKRHATLEEAAVLIARYGYDVNRIPLLLSVIRNPYALEVSLYAYFRQVSLSEQFYFQEYALKHDFESFVIERKERNPTGFENYLLLEGKMPSRLRLVRCEHLTSDTTKELGSVGIVSSGSVPWVNQSKHGDPLSYYTSAAEEAVYQKYRWIFDQGLYPRMQWGANRRIVPEAIPSAVGMPEGERRELAERVRHAVVASVPADQTVLVVSKGDDDLLNLGGRRVEHFPQDDEGYYAGAHPADSAEAISHLETLRGHGAQFLLFPRTAFWWLDHYVEFAQHLQWNYPLVAHDDACRIYALGRQETDTFGGVARCG